TEIKFFYIQLDYPIFSWPQPRLYHASIPKPTYHLYSNIEQQFRPLLKALFGLYAYVKHQFFVVEFDYSTYSNRSTTLQKLALLPNHFLIDSRFSRHWFAW